MSAAVAPTWASPATQRRQARDQALLRAAFTDAARRAQPSNAITAAVDPTASDVTVRASEPSYVAVFIERDDGDVELVWRAMLLAGQEDVAWLPPRVVRRVIVARLRATDRALRSPLRLIEHATAIVSWCVVEGGGKRSLP